MSELTDAVRTAMEAHGWRTFGARDLLRAPDDPSANGTLVEILHDDDGTAYRPHPVSVLLAGKRPDRAVRIEADVPPEIAVAVVEAALGLSSENRAENRIVKFLRDRGYVTSRLGGSSGTLSLAADAIARGEHRG
jgi:hypothetical protein